MTTLFRFLFSSPSSPGFNGAFPAGSITFGSDGALYGATHSGGLYGDGTLYSITTGGAFTKLHDFDLDQNSANNGNDGSGLTQGPDGRFYGVTQYGGPFGQSGSTFGTAYRLESDGTVTTLHAFNGQDGQWPRGDLVLASDGNLYGTTWVGGGLGGANCPYNGCGTVFRITLPAGTVQLLHAFSLTDGSAPGEGRLIQGSDGNLYGTTEIGGNGQFSGGTVFKLALDGTFTLLHSFTAAEGVGPRGSLVEGNDGNFYGTTSGTPNNTLLGTLFRMSPTGDVTVLHQFQGPDGAHPLGGLVQGSDGHFYGTTTDGGENNFGVVFRLVMPRALSDTLAVVEDTSAQGTLSAIDPNNAPFTFSIVSDGLKGSVTLNDPATGAFTYTPNANATGADSFTFRANNGTVDTDVATISVTISPVNDPPLASAGTASVTAGSSVTGTLVANDVDSPNLSYVIATNGTQGVATITNVQTGAYTYAANSGSSGSDTFSFTASDGSLTSSPATVTVTITGSSCATDISTSIAVTQSQLKLNRKTGRYTQTVTLRNGNTSISGPVSLALDGLSASATLSGAVGVTACLAPLGSPYINVNVGTDAVFGPRERATATLEFVSPSGPPVVNAIRVLAGAGTR